MNDVWTRAEAVVIAFPDAASRPQRPGLPPNEPRGEILFFTGVRYERPPHSGPRRPFASGGSGRRS